MFALYCTLETLQGATDPERAMVQIRRLLLRSTGAVSELARLVEENPAVVDTQASGPELAVTAVSDFLSRLCRLADKPLVVFIDEADCFFGQVLISFLRQLRDGYVNRDDIPFPASIALVGMLDVRDYKAQIRPDGESLGQISPFNIISEDMMLRNFTEDEVRKLYAQHTAATGQVFTPDALDAAMEWSGGQPWLVNALARECVEKIHDFRYDEPVTAADIEEAKETIIRDNPIHLDYLFDMVTSSLVKPYFDSALSGKISENDRGEHGYFLLKCLGVLREKDGRFDFVNGLYRDYFKRRLSGTRLFTIDKSAIVHK